MTSRGDGGTPTSGADVRALADELDRALIDRVARGDHAALGELYDRHGGLLLGVGIRILRRPRDAEDILHDVFLEAWRHAGDYDPRRASVRSWLLLRMRSRCLDRVRSAGVSRVEPLEVESVAAVDASELDQDGARLHAALAALSVEQRAVLELGYFEGLSSSEIAARLSIPIGTVKSRVAAALGRLRSALGSSGASP